MRPALLCALLALAGCGHTLTVAGRDGTVGTGTATSGVGSGTVDVEMAGERYLGHWAAVNDGGFSPSAGTVLAVSDRGSRLRCRFTYGGMTGAGFGTCQDGAGRDYDLQIR